MSECIDLTNGHLVWVSNKMSHTESYIYGQGMKVRFYLFWLMSR
nr:MAG TPA: PQQ enzyme repeat [Bacteriophage sp.]